MISIRRSLLPSFLLVVGACGGGGGTEPPAPSLVVAVTTNPLSNVLVGTTLATTPTFEVRSSAGRALSGVAVNVVVSSGGGTLTGAPTVSLAGPTPIGTWTLGGAAGAQTVTVTAAGVTPLVFTVNAIATAGPPASMVAVQGTGQAVLAGAPLPVTPRVRLFDQFGNPVEGQNVLWQVTAGGGTLSGSATVATDASGFANAPQWTIGRRGGTQTLGAAVGAITTSFSATTQSSFNITLRYVGTAPTGAVAQAFTDAVNRISAMVVGDIPDAQIGTASSPFNVSACNSEFTGVPTLNEVVDDVIIYASVVAIDGVGQVLGSAGPCLTRTNGGLTGLGTMRFDSADLANLAGNGRLNDVITHEMLHVVGLGTLWTSKNLLVDRDLATVRVIGPLATAACANDLGGASVCVDAVPAENCLDLPGGVNCGAGTQNSHWKESIFQTELMTGYAGATNVLSKMTIQGLGDLGYVVNTLAADPYVVPSSLMALLRAEGDAAPAVEMGPPTELPAPRLPRFTVERDGRVRPLMQ